MIKRPFQIRLLSHAISGELTKSQIKQSQKDIHNLFSKEHLTNSEKFKKNASPRPHTHRNREKASSDENFIDISETVYTPINPPTEVQVSQLAHNLDRVLFSPGVHFLQDPRTRVFSFTPFLQKIISSEEFNHDMLTKFVSSSKDEVLGGITREHDKRYYGSTSSLTGILSQIHYLLSNFRPINVANLSKHFPESEVNFTRGAKCPAVVIVRQNKGVYSIDSDKSSDRDLILSVMGHTLETFLTTPPDKFKHYYMSNKNTNESQGIQSSPKQESYHYAKMGGFVMRSQLDCRDPRLPGTGTFDLKTRAVCAIRHDIDEFQMNPVTGYQIVSSHGEFESFEREYYELAKSAMLKYSMQARIGNMDGVFVAYHNLAKIFGFQYLPLGELDRLFHTVNSRNKRFDIDGPLGSDRLEYESMMAQQIATKEFQFSIKLLNQVLDKLTLEDLPNTSFRLVVRSVQHFNKTEMIVVAVPLSEEMIERIQCLGDDCSKLDINDMDLLRRLSERKENESLSDELHRQTVIRSKQKQEFNKIVDETAEFSVGYKISVNHFFDDIPNKHAHPYPPSLSSEWKISYSLDKLSEGAAKAEYITGMNAKRAISWPPKSIFAQNLNSESSETKVAPFIQTLRAYSEKGKKRENLWASQDGEPVVWEPKFENDFQ